MKLLVVDLVTIIVKDKMRYIGPTEGCIEDFGMTAVDDNQKDGDDELTNGDDAGAALLVIQKIMVMMLKTIVVMMTRVG